MIETNKQNNKEDLLLINAFYNRALIAILDNNFKSAIKILNEEMPVSLWDIALVILDDRHPKLTNK